MSDPNQLTLSPEKRELLIHYIIDYFATEQDINVGSIAADEILTFFLKNLSRELYNQALFDSQKVIRQGIESIIGNVDLLTKVE